MVDFYVQVDSRPASQAASWAANSLALLVNNAMAGAPGGVSGSTSMTIGTAGEAVSKGIYPVFVQTLASKGYFAPDVIAQTDQVHALDIPDPTQPVPSNNSSGLPLLNAPLSGGPGAWVFDAASPGGLNWMGEAHVVAVQTSIIYSGVGGTLIRRFVVGVS